MMMGWFKFAAATVTSLYLLLGHECRSVHAEDGFWIGMSDDIFMSDDDVMSDDNFISGDGAVLDGDCNPEEVLANPENKEFNSNFTLSFSSDVLDATEEELDALVQAMLCIFNGEHDLCDEIWRHFDSIKVDLDFAGRRVLVEDTSAAPSSSLVPSAAPTPSSTIVDEADFLDVLFTITGSCSDCDPEDFDLFAPVDTIGLVDDELLDGDFPVLSESDFLFDLTNLVNETHTISFLPDISAGGLASEVDDAFNDDDFSGDDPCPGNHTLVETVETVIWFGGDTVSYIDLDKAFICSYNGLTDQSSCDNTASIFLPTKGWWAHWSAYSLSAEYTIAGNWNVEFELSFCCDEECMDCSSIFHKEPIFEGDEQSVLFETPSSSSSSITESGNDGNCFCDSSGGLKRAPTKSEFEAAFQLCN